MIKDYFRNFMMLVVFYIPFIIIFGLIGYFVGYTIPVFWLSFGLNIFFWVGLAFRMYWLASNNYYGLRLEGVE